MIREPAVADMFYPADPAKLQAVIDSCLKMSLLTAIRPKAMIVPHAGYIYSGPIAANAYIHLEPIKTEIKQVILLGPSHKVVFRGLALTNASHFATPFGMAPIINPSAQTLRDFPQLVINDEAHQHEHSLEVQLPFIQSILDDFSCTPIVVGDATADEVAHVIDQLWGGPETIILISSDLSHYHDYDSACVIDQETTKAIESFSLDDINHDKACGSGPICGLLKLAKIKNMQVKAVDLRNSGDTAGAKDRVVGYGAYLFY